MRSLIAELLAEHPEIEDTLTDLVEHDVPKGEARNRAKRALQELGRHQVRRASKPTMPAPTAA
jgi:hypothetical protein